MSSETVKASLIIPGTHHHLLDGHTSEATYDIPHLADRQASADASVAGVDSIGAKPE
jgi:hypothetical protein